MSWPSTLTVNAWTGEEGGNALDVSREVRRWALYHQAPLWQRTLRPEPEIPLSDWRHSRVGWGLVLADGDGTDAEKAHGEDAPPAIQRLLAERVGSPVLRYRAEDGRVTHLRRYYEDGPPHDIAIAGSARGSGRGQLPRYLLIYGTPAEVPWVLQYVLNSSTMVGRLHLEGDALDRYVDHLIKDWSSATSRVDQPLVWATDWGATDITRLMRRSIAEPVFRALHGDDQIGGKAQYIDGSTADASAPALIDALADRNPGLVVTTSHGATSPLDDRVALTRNLGRPVDNKRRVLDIDALCAAWRPDGAIWYAHACCSAGSDEFSQYADMVPEGSTVHRILTGVANLGPTVAPLPTALLSAEKPLRAFVGHVEPTFDWTIQDPDTRQYLTDTITKGLYDQLYQPYPIGLAFRETLTLAGQLFALREGVEFSRYDRGEADGTKLLALRLAGCDRQSTVILGDPTAALPSL